MPAKFQRKHNGREGYTPVPAPFASKMELTADEVFKVVYSTKVISLL